MLLPAWQLNHGQPGGAALDRPERQLPLPRTEKRQILEYALKEELYNWRDDVRPRIYGKFDERDNAGGEWSQPRGQWLLPARYELSPALIAKAIASMVAVLTDPFGVGHMGMTAENLAVKHGFTREQQDALAVESQRRAAVAIDEGRFKSQIVPIVKQI